MKKIKYLMPILGISSIAATAIPLTACSCTGSRQIIIETNDADTIQSTNLYNDLVIILTPKDTNMMITGVSQVKIGDTVLSSVEYSFNNNKVTITQEILNKYSGSISISTTLIDKTTVKKIVVKSKPTKDTYNAGEKLDLKGLVLTGTCVDGSTKTIKEGYTSIPAEGEPVPYGTTEVKVIYGNAKTTFLITVNPAILDSIEVTTKPKTTYNVGDKLDLTGMVVTGTYTDGHKEIETYDSTNPAEGTELTEQGSKDVTVTVGSKTTKFTITVNPVVVTKYITLTATTSTTLTWNDNSGITDNWLQYDDGLGQGWQNLNSSESLMFGNARVPSIKIRGYLKNDSDVGNNNIVIANEESGITPTAVLSGSIMNLLMDKTTEEPATTLPDENAFSELFENSTGLVGIDETTAGKLLPCETLANSCYANMFSACSNLKNAPELPSTNLAFACYAGMFYGCSSLVNGPTELPATKLTESCYSSMFNACKAMENAPIIKATELKDTSCFRMFMSCEKISVTDENHGAVGTKFFTCPDTTNLNMPTDDMFYYVPGGRDHTDPQTGDVFYFTKAS